MLERVRPDCCARLQQLTSAVTLEAMGCKDVTDRRACTFAERGVCTGTYYWRS